MKTIYCVAGVMTALLLSACASPKPYSYWHKEETSKEKTNQVLNFCKEDVGADMLSDEQAKKMVSYCMRSKGFTLKTGYR